MEIGRSGLTRWSVMLAAIVAVGVLPADAGRRKKKAAPAETTTVSAEIGDINPTNVSVVSTDFGLASATIAVADEQLQAPTAHVVATGKGVIVAVLDGGFDLSHPAIADRVLPGWDALSRDDDVNDLGDGVDKDRDGIVDRGVGHGTFVACMVLRAAPGATILPIRIRTDEGHGSNLTTRRGIRHAIDAGADVINLSVDSGSARPTKGIELALEGARKRGITVVVASGNDGLRAVTELAAHEHTLAVGAVDAFDRVADFSNYIDSPSTAPRMVFAPGVGLYGPLVAGEYGIGNGTSFAAGYVSGAAALVRERHPEWGAAEVSEVIAASVQPVWTPKGEMLRHAGRVDLLMAVSR